MNNDARFVQESGTAVFNGNELLVKGALEVEGGVHLLTGYPGSPVSGYFDTLGGMSDGLAEKGMVARIAVNEAVSVAMVNGVQMVGGRGITAMKSVGLHVASDALALGVLGGTLGDSGGLIITGDDPWNESTQVPADSRYLAAHVRLPLIEPSSLQEVKDWVNLGFKLGQAGEIYIGYCIMTALASGGGTVECKPNHYPVTNEKQKMALSYHQDIEPTLEKRVLLPPRTGREEVRLESRFAKVKTAARELGINRIVNGAQRGERVPMGFVASGVSYSFLTHALSEMGLMGRVPILKLGLVYPVDEKIVGDFARQCEQLIVVEERRGFVEEAIGRIVNDLRQGEGLQTEVWGKKFPGGHAGIPETSGLSPSMLMEKLIPVLRGHPTLPVELTNGNLSAELARIEKTKEYDVDLPLRTPTFCPGCPHRDSSNVLLELRNDLLNTEYMAREHRRKPVDMVAHGDTGCYTMLMFPPNEKLMHNYSGMGLGGATGAGVDPFIENKQIVFMGDGTFYHSGQVSISQSIYNDQDITYIILENKTTAMTGHQPHESNEFDLMKEERDPLDIERIVKGMVPKDKSREVKVVRINPEDRDRYRTLLEQTVLSEGVKVVIADKECGITKNRKKRGVERREMREKGFLAKKTYMNVAEEVCEYCLECTTQTGCPALKTVETDYGKKMQTDFSTCVDDGACARIGACPAFEELTIYRKEEERKGDEYVDLTDIPDAVKPIHADQDIWRCYLSGIGGMGIGLTTSILVLAGQEMGYNVQFLEKKGLAIRGGGVFSQLVFTRGKEMAENWSGGLRLRGASEMTSAVIPNGKADLIIGIDLLEACRAIDPKMPYRVASPDKTSIIVNTTKTATIQELMGNADTNIEKLEAMLRKYTKKEGYVGARLGELCERMLDNKLYVNVMMLGVAFQQGLLPLRLETLERAIKKITGAEWERNLRAFGIGRKLAVQPELFEVFARHEYETSRQTMRRKVNLLRAWYSGKRGERISKQFRVLMKQTFRATMGMRVADHLMRDVIVRAYDCVIWGGIKYAEQYCKRVVEVFHKDHPEYGLEITRAVVHNLAKVMLIKDEVYVSSMLTSPEKYRRDRLRFNVNAERGDRIDYTHINKPEFVVFGRPVKFDIKTKDWMLRMMSGMGVLRKLLPAWHSRERAFRDWYDQMVERLDWHEAQDYKRWLSILSVPDQVRGYREVRYPKMEQARKDAEMYLDMPPDQFKEAVRHPVDAPVSVELPIIYTTH
ncbi:DUF6537 domain-containing protein [Poriferisphaera sp. WC338]|uniref:DUF6537 domain-containing protein n=1 Tax=Poriferisphaera sp. WC338 TaxID=3425129 RepID=UPI003D815D26